MNKVKVVFLLQQVLVIMYLKWALLFTVIHCCTCANILMITMGGTKSHKIPFFELARGLIPRGHNVTFLNAFPSDFYLEGLEEVTPTSYVVYINNFTNWDLVGARIKGEEPVPLLDMIKFGYEVPKKFKFFSEKCLICGNCRLATCCFPIRKPKSCCAPARNLICSFWTGLTQNAPWGLYIFTAPPLSTLTRWGCTWGPLR